MSPPATPGGCSMAPPLEPPSTIQPAQAAGVKGGCAPPAMLSPFLQRVARQMQLDAELLRHSQLHTQAQQQMLQLDVEALSLSHGLSPMQRDRGTGAQIEVGDKLPLMTDSLSSLRLPSESGHALHAADRHPQHTQHDLDLRQTQSSAPFAEHDANPQASCTAAKDQQGLTPGVASPPSVASASTQDSQQGSRQLPACETATEHTAAPCAHQQTPQRSGNSASCDAQPAGHQQHPASSRQSAMGRASIEDAGLLTPVPTSIAAGLLPGSRQASNSIGNSIGNSMANSIGNSMANSIGNSIGNTIGRFIGDGQCLGGTDMGRAMSQIAGSDGQHPVHSDLSQFSLLDSSKPACQAHMPGQSLSKPSSSQDGLADVHRLIAKTQSEATDHATMQHQAPVKAAVHAVHGMTEHPNRARGPGPEETRVKKRKGRSSWADHKPDDWIDDSSSSCSSAGTRGLAASDMESGFASESMLLPLELPSPMPCTSSEGNNQPSNIHFVVCQW